MIAAPYNQQRHAGGYPCGVYTDALEGAAAMPKGIYERRSQQDRFAEKWSVDPATGCHEWRAARNTWGYGQFQRGGCNVGAHRVAWEMAHGPIPSGMCACHHCDNRGCVNVGNMFLGTIAENNADMRAKGRSRGAGLGCKHWNARMSDAQIRTLRAMYASGEHTHKTLAESLGCSASYVGQVLRGERRAGGGQ